MHAADLCAPLPGLADAGDPGPDLAFSTEFDTIARWREEDDAGLAQGEWRSTPRRADWDAVRRETELLLHTRCKDLRLAGWWGEASAQLQGLPGLADGMELLAALCERWWPRVHPAVDGADADARAGVLRWWLARSERLAPSAPVLRLGRQALGLAEIERTRRQAQDDPAAGSRWHEVQAALGHGDGSALAAATTALPRALQALHRLKACCDAGLGEASPSFDAAREALEAAARTLARLRQDIAPAAAPGPAEEAAAEAAATVAKAPAATMRPPPGVAVPTPAGDESPPIGRDEAIAQLRRIAEFLRRTEPHNPAAYLADKAARWAGLALHAWLREVIADEQALARLETTLGVARDAEPGR
ncbi:MAG: type VI secretion system protein TssA [Rubrivivax sp.]